MGVPQVAGLSAGERVAVEFTCGARLTSGLRATPDGRLVLDIPGDHFVIRLADGRPADDIATIRLVEHPVR
ncbi:hypothetical protein BJY21_002135 [Kineosphaera limosa]|uniref:Uncharacterized protein n=1 Tax=Kineosphaera limosa NBRC 100340 TaxID=1184609 RepID=K6VFB1_9MICO|nr:hypothetical protein [Kineosphaera limosa]NYE00951.1 hypothetical protein [Kineosphaera limosa]GAB94853.1 hypothetical protein KILIM_013_00080 [Kineosphaera limosa NBRC 100340]